MRVSGENSEVSKIFRFNALRALERGHKLPEIVMRTSFIRPFAGYYNQFLTTFWVKGNNSSIDIKSHSWKKVSIA